MKKLNLLTVLVLSLSIFSCKESTEKAQPSEKIATLEPNVDVKEIQSNYKDWWTYHSYNISLTSNFTALNSELDTIGKKKFLEQLTTGDYIPLSLSDETNTYKLYKLDSLGDNGISSTIKDASLRSLKYFNMEGMPFPEFDFTDLNGNNYTNENTKGKTVILKTWFINCKACIAEFPELNEFVEKHEQNEDVIFVSLAKDQKPELEKFLQKKEFKYQVIPEQTEFTVDKLNLRVDPTHVIIDKTGIIKKVVNDASEMISYYENKQPTKQKKSKLALPPPPGTK